MNIRTIGIIIRREYLNRVHKKSFLVTTFLVPVLMAALCVVPIVMMMNTKDKVKKIAVVDRSTIVMPYLENTETLQYVDYGDFELDSVKANMSSLALDAVLSISPLDSVGRTVSADITSLKPLGLDAAQNIGHRVNAAVEAYRIASYRIDGLEQIMKDVKSNIKVNSYTMDEEGKETVSETGVFAAISMVFGLMLFLFITLFGGMVMSAVIEEKASRVVEVLVSSVKATELMFGKIIGIALVALTQFLLWIVLTGMLVSAAGSVMGQDIIQKIQNVDTTVVAQEASPLGETALQAAEGDELSVVLSTVKNLPYGEFIAVFLLFFLFGYMLYASLFAAVGSAVESEGDSQQLQLPLTIPLMIGYFMAIYTFNAPDSTIAVWGSMIPFTSPIVMLARLPFGVPSWEIALSLGLLVVTFIICAWISAKIYKVGILMFGKKSTWKDLWKWLKQD